MSQSSPSAGDAMGSQTPEAGRSGDRPKIAYFVSPHGFGHAARAAAVMAAIHRRHRRTHFEIFTTVPAWFFEKSLLAPFKVHAVETDVGFAQDSPFIQDLARTRRQLDRFLPFDAGLVDGLARQLRNRDCRLVICDISPLGIAVGRAAGLPTVLIENFTWDWLYAGDDGFAEKIERHIDYLRRWFGAADLHIQTEPVCAPQGKTVVVGPVSRPARIAGPRVRRQLEVPPEKQLVLVTTGGVPERYEFLQALKKHTEVVFVVPGGARSSRRRDNCILLPVNSTFFHPDLVAAADAVVGKVGYSTLAEVHAAGVPFGYVVREGFRESRVLVDFIRKNMTGLGFDVGSFYSAEWLRRLPELMAMPRRPRPEVNGGGQIAECLAPYIASAAI
jgi:hypothetical protein